MGVISAPTRRRIAARIAFAGASVVIGVVAAAWVRSYWVADSLHWDSTDTGSADDASEWWYVHSCRGVMGIGRHRSFYAGRSGILDKADPDEAGRSTFRWDRQPQPKDDLVSGNSWAQKLGFAFGRSRREESISATQKLRDDFVEVAFRTPFTLAATPHRSCT